MKFSTKGRYGLRAMIDLAVYANNEHVPLSSIAQRQEISLNYLEQVFSMLKKAGLVKSVKGAQGGYKLSKRPKNITVGDILRVLEGPVSITDMEKTGDETVLRSCLRKNVWDRIDEALNNYVDTVDLNTLAEEYKRANGLDDHMYYI